MAAHESLHDYYLHQHRDIEYYLKQCMHIPEAEMVHQLRLSIKKLRAFNKLAEQLCLTEMDEHIHMKQRVTQLYKMAGQLRDTQVQLQMLISLEESSGTEYPEFRSWLLRREKKRIERFIKKLKHPVNSATPHITHRKIEKTLAAASDITLLNAAGTVLVSLLANARKLALGRMSDNDLHRIRILSKQMRYIFSIMQHSYPAFKFNDLSVDLLREIEATTGHWHDCLVKIELLSRCIEKLQDADKSTAPKYQNLMEGSKSELHLAYEDACQIVHHRLLPAKGN